MKIIGTIVDQIANLNNTVGPSDKIVHINMDTGVEVTGSDEKNWLLNTSPISVRVVKVYLQVLDDAGVSPNGSGNLIVKKQSDDTIIGTIPIEDIIGGSLNKMTIDAYNALIDAEDTIVLSKKGVGDLPMLHITITLSNI